VPILVSVVGVEGGGVEADRVQAVRARIKTKMARAARRRLADIFSSFRITLARYAS
jgi:hypothetical protein